MNRGTALLLVGALSTMGQIVLLREVAALLYGVELTLVLALGAWLVGTATGVVAAGTLEEGADLTAATFAAFGIAPAAMLVVARVGPYALGAPTGAYLPFLLQLLLIVLLLMPAGAIGGALFLWITRDRVAGGEALGVAYAIESAGAMLGGLGATAAFALGASTSRVAGACAALALLGAVVTHDRRPVRVATLGLAGVVGATAFMAGPYEYVDRWLGAWSRPALIEMRDTPYGRVSVTRTGDQLAVFQDNALWFDNESVQPELFAHLVALAHDRPARMLLLGGALTGLPSRLLEHSVERLDVVELDRSTFDFLAGTLGDRDRAQTSGGAVRVLFDDPRRYLTKPVTYDVIVVGMPEPETGAANRFYTREFFLACRARLGARGLVGLRLSLTGNVLAPDDIGRLASVHRAARDVFRDVLVLPAEGLVVLLASDTAIPRAPETWVDRLRTRRIAGALVSPPFLSYVLTNDRQVAAAQAIARAGVAANTDVRPSCYQYAIMRWLGRVWPAAAGLRARLAGRPGQWLAVTATVAAVLVSLVIGLLAGRRGPAGQRVLLVGVAGAVGMALEAVLLLHYQLKNGVLYQNIGLLVTGFMAGLALGALCVGRTKAAAWRWSGLTGLAATAFLTGQLISHGAGHLAAVLALTVSDGCCVAAVFAQAGSAEPCVARRLVSPLYAADVAGGALAAVVIPLISVPGAGLAATAYGAGAMAAVALLLSWRLGGPVRAGSA